MNDFQLKLLRAKYKECDIIVSHYDNDDVKCSYQMFYKDFDSVLGFNWDSYEQISALADYYYNLWINPQVFERSE